VNELNRAGIDPYPREWGEHTGQSLSQFDRVYHTLKKGETKKDEGTYQGSLDLLDKERVSS
jgi:hypothetical protein